MQAAGRNNANCRVKRYLNWRNPDRKLLILSLRQPDDTITHLSDGSSTTTFNFSAARNLTIEIVFAMAASFQLGEPVKFRL